MARNFAFLVLLSLLLIGSKCEAAIFNPISDSHRSAALELFATSDGSYESLEDTYKALRTFEVLGIEKSKNVKDSSCKAVMDILHSPSADSKDLFKALRVNGILECELNHEAFVSIASKLKDSINGANSLHDFYNIVGSLQLVKDQSSEVDVLLEDAEGLFRSIKALSQSDGKWRYSSKNTESSTYAAGLAFEALAGVLSLASTEIDQSLIDSLKNDILKLFDTTEKYDDGSCYFDEKLINGQGPLSASSSVVRGISAFAASTSEGLNVPSDKVHCLAKFFLSIGAPGNAEDLYHQIDALAYLENNRYSVPLILSLPATVLSLSKKDQLKVQVTTVLGSAAPPLSVKLKQIFASGSKDGSVINQELEFDSRTGLYFLDTLPNDIDVGKYIFTFEAVLHDPELKKVYVTGGRTKVAIHVTGNIQVGNSEIEILDSDVGSVEKQNLDLTGLNAVALSANHLQKLRLSFELTTPLGHTFKPHQSFLKLRHESSVEHIFIVGNSENKFEIVLDFLGLVEKFYYLSGKYDIELVVGDSTMENSFVQSLGHVELDLPDAPEKAPRPPTQSVDLYTRFGPKAEISHIFRVPEKRPVGQLSYAFLGLVLLPLIGFVVGLLVLGVNLKNFPRAGLPAIFAILFHLGIGAVLSLYLLFWIKLDLFTTFKALGVLEIFLMVVGHRTLSYLASTSAKLKSA